MVCVDRSPGPVGVAEVDASFFESCNRTPGIPEGAIPLASGTEVANVDCFKVSQAFESLGQHLAIDAMINQVRLVQNTLTVPATSQQTGRHNNDSSFILLASRDTVPEAESTGLVVHSSGDDDVFQSF